jgi:hypothetical protein
MSDIPHLGMIQAAYLADDIDLPDLERLTEAALAQTATEIPERIVRLFYAPNRSNPMPSSPPPTFAINDAR